MTTQKRPLPKNPTLYAGFIVAVIPIGFCLYQARAGNVGVPDFGAASLGVLIGMLIGFFVQEAEKWDKRALSSAALALTGGGVLGFMHWAAPPDATAVWFYPIGLLAGFGLGTIWDAVDPA